MSGKINLSIGEMQGRLRQMLESDLNLTAEDRYTLMSSIEAWDFVKTITPGLRKAIKEHKSMAAKKTK